MGNESNDKKLASINFLKSNFDEKELLGWLGELREAKKRVDAVSSSVGDIIAECKEKARLEKLRMEEAKAAATETKVVEEEVSVPEAIVEASEVIQTEAVVDTETKTAEKVETVEKTVEVADEQVEATVEQVEAVQNVETQEKPQEASDDEKQPIATEEKKEAVAEKTEKKDERKRNDKDGKVGVIRHIDLDDPNRNRPRQGQRPILGQGGKVYIPDQQQRGGGYRGNGGGYQGGNTNGGNRYDPQRRASNFLNRDRTAEKASIEMTASVDSQQKKGKGKPERNSPAAARDEKGVKKGYRREQFRDYDEDLEINRKLRRKKQGAEQKVVNVITNAVITVVPIPIKTLAEKIGRPGSAILKKLVEFNIDTNININASIDFSTAELIALEYGVTLELKLEQTEEEKLVEISDEKDDPRDLVERPPVVTIMGHVDHGKTSLLDYIRKANVVASEAGGITQHIGAYTIKHGDKPITFIDTPGHEAFTTMRLRGAMVTDIAVIVIAADDSVMEQTVEAINHAKVANVPIIVAVNKMDKLGVTAANIEQIKTDLSMQGIMVDSWGGDTMLVPVSAKTGEGVPRLLEAILMIAELQELKANPKRAATGFIIEAKLDKNTGPVATLLVKNGTLHVSDYVVAGTVIGKIRAMTNDKKQSIKVAGPSEPVSVLGFESVPAAGDTVTVVEEKLAKRVQEERIAKERSSMVEGFRLEDIHSKLMQGDLKELNLLIKGDVQGSVEALVQQMKKLSNDEVKVNVIHSAVGGVNESDIMLAANTNAFVVCFNVRPDQKAKAASAKLKVEIRNYKIIYDVVNDISNALVGMLEPSFEEQVLGRAEVKNTFKITGVGTIAGCYVLDGKLQRDTKVRLLRNNIIIFDGDLASLKRLKADVKEVTKGFECGVGLEKYNDIKVGDAIECYIIVEKKA